MEAIVTIFILEERISYNTTAKTILCTMKPNIRTITLLLLILVSCSSYEKVSLSSFKEYMVSYEERTDLQYVLKKHRLHYSDTDRRFIINNFEANESEAYERHNVHFEDNIVIPAITSLSDTAATLAVTPVVLILKLIIF